MALSFSVFFRGFRGKKFFGFHFSFGVSCVDFVAKNALVAPRALLYSSRSFLAGPATLVMDCHAQTDCCR
jgi:hypothetical protein